MNLDDLREDFLELVKKFGLLEDQLRVEIAEYRKTVNTALGLLSKELLDFIDRDVVERKARQKRQDIKDIAIGCIGILTLVIGCSIISLLILLYYRGAVL